MSLAEASCAVRHKGTESAMALLRRRVDAAVPLGETTVIPAITYKWLPRGETHAGVVLLLHGERAPSQLASPPRGAFADADPDVKAGDAYQSASW